MAPRHTFRLGLMLFACGMVVRLALLFTIKPHVNPVGNEMQNIIHALVAKGSIADPFPTPTGPTAHYSPLYPLLIWPIYALFGETPGALLAQFVLNLAAASLQYAFLPWLAVQCGLPLAAGVAAGLLGALLPVNFLTEAKMHEPWIALAGILLTGVTVRGWSSDYTVTRSLRQGVGWGLSWLLNPFMLTLWATLMAAALWMFRPRWRSVLMHAFITGAVGVALLLPWGLRNQAALGKFILTRSNLGLELAVSNNDLTHATFDENIHGVLTTHHPYNSPAEAQLVRDLGEAGYHRRKWADFRQWVATHPGRFLELTAQRVLLFWFPWTPRFGQMAVLWLLTPLTFIGLWQVRRLRPAGPIFVLMLLAIPVLYYFVQAAVRYRYQLQWVFFLLAGAVRFHADASQRSGAATRQQPV